MGKEEDIGVIYCASGKAFLTEAAVSATSVKKAMPNLKVVIFTNVLDDVPTVFDESYPLEAPTFSYEDKILALKNLPFRYNLFLDTDTYVVESCLYLFELLDYFDVCVAQDPWRIGPEVEKCPPAYPEWNTGVILLKREDRVRRFIEDWLYKHRKRRNADAEIGDQATFREALYVSGLRAHCLPQEYNFRTLCPNFAGAHAKVKIIHGRGVDHSGFAKLLNDYRDFRTYHPSILHYLNSKNAVLPNKPGRCMQRCIYFIVAGIYWLRGYRFDSNFEKKRKRLLS